MGESRERFRSDSLRMVLLGIAAGATSAYALTALGIPAEVTGAVTSGAALLPPAIGNALYEKRARKSGYSRIQTDPSEKPRVLVIALTVGALLLTNNVLSLLLAFVAGIGLAVVMELDLLPVGALDRDGLAALGLASAIPIALLVWMPIMFLIARQAAHYLGQHPYAWTLVVVVCFATLQAILEIVTGGGVVETITSQAVTFSLDYGIAALGCFYAIRSHAQFIVSRAFRKLPPEDREAVLTLVTETLKTLPPAGRRETPARSDGG